jgi:hypothetical protein
MSHEKKVLVRICPWGCQFRDEPRVVELRPAEPLPCPKCGRPLNVREPTDDELRGVVEARKVKPWAYKLLVFLVIAEAIALFGVGQHLYYRVERVELLEEYKATCDQFIKLADKNTQTETKLRVGYARVVERVFERLGLVGYSVPGADGEILRVMLRNGHQKGKGKL